MINSLMYFFIKIFMINNIFFNYKIIYYNNFIIHKNM